MTDFVALCQMVWDACRIWRIINIQTEVDSKVLLKHIAVLPVFVWSTDLCLVMLFYLQRVTVWRVSQVACCQRCAWRNWSRNWKQPWNLHQLVHLSSNHCGTRWENVLTDTRCKDAIKLFLFACSSTDIFH